MTQTKEQAQIQLQNALTTTFLANLAFLSEYDNELYQRVDELSRMIENGTYKEKYALEFVMENGDFEIYDIVNDRYMYDRNPKKRNDELVRKVDFDEKNSIFNVDEYFTNRDKIENNFENRFEITERLEAASITANDIFEYTSTLKDYLDSKKKRYQSINKFVFLGTLLGRHIPRIAEKIDAKIYLVLERNLEIFRLSLFTVDYTILAKKGAIFSIMDDEEKEKEKIELFLNIYPLDNYLIKFSTTNINIERYRDILLYTSVKTKKGIYDYNRYLYFSLNRTTNILNSEYNTIQINKLQDNINFFENSPILYLAAGPSIDENIEWIKENQDKFFIVAVGAVYKKLISNKIRIDMITTLDEDPIIRKIQFDDEGISEIDESTIILANTSTNEEVLKKLNERHKLYLYESGMPLLKDNLAFSGYSIGELTILILLSMNPKNIYVLGLDLALNQETGESHTKNSFSSQRKYELDIQDKKEQFSLNQGLVKVKGNLQDEVSTTSLFTNSINFLNFKLKEKDEKINIYNLSKHGAYIQKTIPINCEDIKIENFKKNNFDIEKLNVIFKENSISKINQDTKDKIIDELEIIDNIILKKYNELKNSNFSNYEQYLDCCLDNMNNINENKIYFLYLILRNYYEIIFPYLNYHFNDKKLKDEKKKVEKIKNIFTKQIIRIISDYKICLERLIK